MTQERHNSVISIPLHRRSGLRAYCCHAGGVVFAACLGRFCAALSFLKTNRIQIFMWKKLRSHPWWLAMAGLLLIALIWTAYKIWFAKPASAPLITATVERGDIENSVLATGTIQASQLVNVGSQVSGQLKKLHVKVGDSVKQGQLVAEIDDTTQRNNLREAQEQVAYYRAQRAAKQSSLVLAQQNFERQKYMHERDASSKSDYQSAKQALDAARAEVKALDAQIAQSSVQIETAKANVGYTRITAPSDGVVVSIVTKEGQTVSASQSAPTIIKLANLDTMRIEAQISEADVPNVTPGMPAYFTILGDPDTKHDAVLNSVEPGPINMSSYEGTNTDSSSSTAVYYNGIFDVPNPDHRLRIQMTAQVTIVLQQAKNVLLIPSGALSAARSGKAPAASGAAAAAKASAPTAAAGSNAGRAGSAGGEGKFYTVRVAKGEPGQQTIEERQVRIGLNNRVQAEVLSGLQEGEQVVVGDASANQGSSNTQRRGPRMF